MVFVVNRFLMIILPDCRTELAELKRIPRLFSTTIGYSVNSDISIYKLALSSKRLQMLCQRSQQQYRGFFLLSMASKHPKKLGKGNNTHSGQLRIGRPLSQRYIDKWCKTDLHTNFRLRFKQFLFCS